MARKQAETEFGEMMNGLGFARHKYGDKRYCWKCKSLQPKSELKPDYLAAVIYTWVECKEGHSKGQYEGRWKWKEIYTGGAFENQRNWLLENGGWLFLLVGSGRVNNDWDKAKRSAYLMPFERVWVKKIEPQLIEYNMGSIGHDPMIGGKPGATELLADYRLAWVNGKWDVPNGHVWWHSIYNRLYNEIEKVRYKLYV